MQKNWHILNNNVTSSEDIIQKILEIRNINTNKKREDFLNSLKMEFTSPYAFCDMQKSVERILLAIEKGEKIVVWGDFDADGVTSTCLMVKTLEFLGADVEYYIPSRHTENHGLNSKGIIQLLKNKMKVLITVDCGSTNAKEIALAKSFGVDVIVTDHHDCDVENPEMYALLNPKVMNNLDENLPLEQIEYLSYLAGVGVSFKLALALLEKCGKKEFVNEILPLVALGSIADVVPLLGENRAFVLMGLDLIQKGVNKGITTLLREMNYNYEINSDGIAFYVAPRINASGRLENAQIAFDLLYEDNEQILKERALKLNELNVKRQELCDEIFAQAIEMVEKDTFFETSSSIVLYNPSWHVGIIGIVASKLVEHFYKPVFLMTEKQGLVACSARGIEETDIHSIISNLSEFIESGGGHKMAGGLAFDRNKISFEKMREIIDDVVKEMVAEIELKPHIDVDLELTPELLTFDLIEELKKLEPFGACNSAPLFCLKDMEIYNAKLMGANANHLKLQCKKGNSSIYDCVFWNREEMPKPKNNLIDLVFFPKINKFNDEVKIQLDLKDVNFEKVEEIKFINQRNKENIEEILEEYLEENDDIKVYAYRKETFSRLEKYQKLSSNILTNVIKTRQLVFLDYPKSLEKMKIILDKIQPEIVHIVGNEVKQYTIDEFLKTLCGLLKFLFNQKNGEINYFDLSNYFMYDEKIIKIGINLLQNAQMLEIEEDVIKKLNIIEMSALKNQEEFCDLEIELEKSNEFLGKMSESSIEEIAKMF